LVVLLTAATAIVYQFSVVSALIFIMGDSILLFSVFTGVFLLSMGVGSVLGARPTVAMDISFIRVQFSLAALGLVALPLVFCLFAASEYARRRGITVPPSAVIFTFWANGLLIDFLFGVLTISHKNQISNPLGPGSARLARRSLNASRPPDAFRKWSHRYGTSS
jgi:predicted membrane-bound spermidine synthase